MSKSSDKIAAAHSSLMALLESRVISPKTRRQVEQVREKVEQELTEVSRTAQRENRKKREANSAQAAVRPPANS